MMLLWNFRYLDRTDSTFNDRELYLLTETLDPVTRAAIELVVDMKSENDQWQILRFRHLFEEHTPESLPTNLAEIGSFRSVGPPDYFEDETGAEVKKHDLWHYLKPKDFPEPEPIPPVPIAEVSLSNDEIRLLGYFLRDQRELLESAIIKEGPGTLSTPGEWTPSGLNWNWFETSLTDDEIRSSVTIYRRLYMENEPANVEKAVAVFVRALGDHPYARYVASFADEYRRTLDSPPDTLALRQWNALSFTTKRLIDVFLYTQYAHQPDDRRQRQFVACLSEVQNNRNMLMFLFLFSLWRTSIPIVNVGTFLERWFQRYCFHHQIQPDVLKSLRDESVGIGMLEKYEDRKARLFREKSEKLASELWNQAGRPPGGPAGFQQRAVERLTRALGGETNREK